MSQACPGPAGSRRNPEPVTAVEDTSTAAESSRTASGRTVTSHDVALAAGVSQSLVSLILSDKPGKKIREQTRAHVRRVAEALGYRPNLQAQAMKRRRARTIGLLSIWETGSFVFPPVVNGLKAVCDREGLALTICTGRTDPDGTPDYVAYFLENRIDGLVFLSHVGVVRAGVIETLERHGMPFVCAIGARDLPTVTSVDVDFRHNGRLAAEHLLASGCRRPVIFLDPSVNYAERERYEGFEAVCREAGVPVVLAGAAGAEPNNERASGHDALRARLRRLLREHPATDGFAAVSVPAWQMLAVARDEGIRVPEQLKVVSLDNEAFAPYLTPALSTVDEPLQAIGAHAGDMLLRLMAGAAPGEKKELPLTLSSRASSGSIPHTTKSTAGKGEHR